MFTDKLPHCVQRGVWSGSCSCLMDVLTALAEVGVVVGGGTPAVEAVEAVKAVEDKLCSQRSLSTHTSLNLCLQTADCNK